MALEDLDFDSISDDSRFQKLTFSL
jgi:hypothetical protein